MRQREFDESDVLDRALNAFWRLGYDGCAISDLLTATGLQRQSLYNAFDDKHGVFVAALARYRHHVATSLTPLDSNTAGMRELRRYIEQVLASYDERGVGGCLIVKTALGYPGADARIRSEIEAGASAVRDAFARVLARAVSEKALPTSTDPTTTAAYLYVVLQGLAALATTGGTPKQIRSVLDLAFDTFAPPKRTTNRKAARS